MDVNLCVVIMYQGVTEMDVVICMEVSKKVWMFEQMLNG